MEIYREHSFTLIFLSMLALFEISNFIIATIFCIDNFQKRDVKDRVAPSGLCPQAQG